MKICVYAISKNEAQFVERFCKSAEDADVILIADTGSTDETVALAEKCGAVVHNICISPWRFDHARNAALALVPADVDVCVSLDLDEVLEPGWRAEIERMFTAGVTRIRHRFDFSQGHIYEAMRVHIRHGYSWKYPCHEFQVPDPRLKEVVATSPMVMISHKPDKSKPRSQYLDMLEMAVKETPNCARSRFYHAREFYYYARWDDALLAFQKYLSLPDATWAAERSYALRVIAECYEKLKDHKAAESHFLKACAEYPTVRDPWYALAQFYYRHQNWCECYAAVTRMSRIAERNYEYVALPECWSWEPHDLAAISCYHLGLHDQAMKHGEAALAINPSDERLKGNLQWYLHGKPPVPNIVHFIHFSNNNSLCRPFSYVNYLAVKSASDVQKPDKIYLYYNVEPADNPHWDAMKDVPGVELVHMEPPESWGGFSLSGFPQYQADLVRLQKLHEIGGIYQDTDAITLKPLNEFFDKDCVISGFNIHGADIETNNSTIIARPGSTFLKVWLERMPESLATGIWAHHCARLPAKLCREFPQHVTLLDNRYFLPYHYYDDKYLNATDPDVVEATLKQSESSHVVHLWETFFKDVIPHIGPEYAHTSGTPLAKILEKAAA